MSNLNKLRSLVQHGEFLGNFPRLLNRAAELLTIGQRSNRPDFPAIDAAEIAALIDASDVRRILAAQAAYNSPELLDPKPEPEPRIVYITVPAEPADEPAAEPAVETPAEPAAEIPAEIPAETPAA